MDILHQIIVMVVTLAVLIAFHEWGHFWVARRCGVKVIRFSIGFGTPLARWKDKTGTEFVFAAFPLGGYVKMLDERESEQQIPEEEKPFAFNNKPVWQRIAIVSAGPLANLILAVLVYWLVFLQGVAGLAPIIYSVAPGSVAEKNGVLPGQEIVAVDGVATNTVQYVSMQLIKRVGDTGHIEVETRDQGSDISRPVRLEIVNWLGKKTGDVDPFADLGIGFYQPVVEPVIDDVLEGSAASAAGLLKGDKLLYADGRAIDSWMQWVDYVQPRANVAIELVLERQGRQRKVVITPRLVDFEGKQIGQVGIRVKPPAIPEHLIRMQEYNVLSAWVPALDRTWQMAVFSLKSMQKMIFGEISYKQLSGPISIARVASESAESGIYSYLSLLALLSVSLGVLNLLPIPVLDGGHIVFYIVEWIRGGPLPEKIQQIAFQIGMVVVLSIMVLAIVNDLGRL